MHAMIYFKYTKYKFIIFILFNNLVMENKSIKKFICDEQNRRYNIINNPMIEFFRK